MEKLNFLIGSYIQTIKAMFSVRLWGPYFAFAVISVVILWLLSNPHLPLLGPAIATVAKWIAGSDSFLHYPDHYVLLPKVYGWVTVVCSIIIEVVLIGAGFLMFFEHYNRKRVSFFSALGRAKARYFQLVAVWLFYSVVFLLFLIYLPKLFDPLIGGSPRRTLAFGIGVRFLGSLVLAVFMYVLPNLLIDGEKLVVSVRRSIRTFGASMFSSYVIALVPYLIVLPFTIVLHDPVLIVTKFYPELVFYLIVGEIVANMFAGFVFTSTVVRFHWEFGE